MKSKIKERIERARAKADGVVTLDGQVVPPPEPQPSFLIEEQYLEAQVGKVLSRLPMYKDMFTPQEVAFAVSRSDEWVRVRFKQNPRCFNHGNASKVYLSIPRDVVAAEVRNMIRNPRLRSQN